MDITVADLVIYAIPALLGAMVSWAIRKSMASRKEAALKREILDAKAAVPILESSVRKGDQHVATLEAQVSDLKVSKQEMVELLEQQRGESALQERQLRNANSELTVLRSGAEDDGHLYMDDQSAPKPGDTDLVERATRAEERYESLKRGLIERDDRIVALQEELEAEQQGGDGDPAAPAQLEALEAARSDLQQQLEAGQETIKQLNQRLEDEGERREVLESLAKGRSEAKLEQREKLANLEQELPALRKTLADSEAMVTQRVATIASLRDQLDGLERDKAQANAHIVELTGSLAERDGAIAEHDTVMETMLRTLEVHKNQIETLTQRNGRTDDALRAAEQRVAERDADVAAREVSTVEAQGTIESLKGSLRDREFKIDSLQTELTRATEQLASSRTELAQSGTSRSEDVARLETEGRQAHERATGLQQAKEQLEARVSAFESSAGADRQRGDENDRAVTERDLTINALEGKLRDAQGQIDALAKERANAEAALQEHEAAPDASNGTPEPAAPAQSPHPEATGDTRLREAEQLINSLENSIKDRDFRIDSLMQDAAALEAKLEVYRAEDAQDQPEEPPSGDTSESPSEDQPGYATTEAREATH